MCSDATISLAPRFSFAPSAPSAAIYQKAAGHPHWKEFTPKNRNETEHMAKEIHSCLFDPELKGSVINTTEVPVAGRVNAAIAAPLLLAKILCNFLTVQRPWSGTNDSTARRCTECPCLLFKVLAVYKTALLGDNRARRRDTFSKLY